MIKKKIFYDKHAPQARFLFKQNAPQARFFDSVLMDTPSC